MYTAGSHKLDRLNNLNNPDRSPIKGKYRDYVVLSKSEANDDNHPAYSVPHVLIAIKDPSDSFNKFLFNDKRLALLYVAFDDIATDAELAKHPQSLLFNEKQARDIAALHKTFPRARFVVHCYAGFRRSPGVVAGLALATDDDHVFEECEKRYWPNQRVRDMVFLACSEGA